MSLLKNRSVLNVLFCLIFIFTAGLLKIYCPMDLYWDLVNYHYYNPWAFIHHRLGYDIAPAMINTYFNPLLDIPYYLMLNAWQNMPSLIYFVQGSFYGVLLFVFFKICELFFDLRKEILAVLISCLIAATGYSIFYQVGTITNEIQVSILIMTGFYIICKYITEDKRKKSVWIIPGLIMGAALGVKPTVITYCLSMGVILFIFAKPLHVSLKEIFIFALSGLLGYLLLNGWWMWQLYSHFDNPFFPFLNKIFKSDYYELYNYYDDLYLKATTGFEKFYLPLLISFASLKHQYVSEGYFFDIRFALVYVILIVIFVKWLISKRELTHRRNVLLYAFIVTSFIIWLNVFSIMRYAIPIEMLGAIIIVKFFQKFTAKSTLGFGLLLSLKIIGIYILLSEALLYFDFCHKKNIDFVHLFTPIEQQINLPENALVETYGYPSAMIAARIVGDKPNRIISFANRHAGSNIDFIEKRKLRQIRDKIKEQHEGPVVAIIASNYFSRKSIEAEVFASYARQRWVAFEKEGMYCRLFLLMDKIIVCTPDEYKEKVFVESKN